MTTLLAILGAITALSGVVVAILKYFPVKTAQQASEEKKTDVRSEMDKFRDSGRPS